MTEDTREAIIQRFDAALVQMHGCSRYTPEDVDELESAAWDVLPLLKAQEPVKPIMRREMDDICSCIDNVAYCGKCGALIGRLKQNYCSNCGQAVKWDG